MHTIATALCSIKLVLMQHARFCLAVHGNLSHHVQPAYLLARCINNTPTQTGPCNQIFAKIQTILNCSCCSDGNECDNRSCPGTRRSTLCKLLRPLSYPMATMLMKTSSNNITDVAYGCCCCMSSLHGGSTCKTHMPVTISQTTSACWHKAFPTKLVPV